MYDNFKLLNYSNSLVSPELYARHQSKLFTGNVVNGLLVIPKTGLIVTLPTGNGFIPYGSGATASNREFSLVVDFDITLDTADASNPRIDLIVIYADLAVTLPGGTPGVANLDGPGVVKATFVKGTPNASPVEPTVGAIQTKIGAANPYIIVAEVRVDALVTTIAANKITDRRVLVGPVRLSAGTVNTATIADANVTTAKIADASVTYTKMNYATIPLGQLSFNSYGTAGGVVVTGTLVVPFNKFTTNSSTQITQSGGQNMLLSQAGWYELLFNANVTDGAGTLQYVPYIQYSTDSTTWYEASPLLHNITAINARGSSMATDIFLPANTYVRAVIFTTGALRFAAASAFTEPQMSLTVKRIG